MRAVWVDEGNDANWDLLRRHGITWAFYSLNEPAAVLRKRLLDTRARGLVAGVYAAWGWAGYVGSGAHFAEEVDRRLKLVCPDATPTWPRVQLNDETHDAARIVQMIQRWRALRPKTATSWTLEGHQGGWFTPELVKAIVTGAIRVVPQCYTGPMLATDSLAAARNITRTGVPDSLVTPFYDGASLQPYGSGFIFTMGRLP